jgi:hypothetical protein
MAGYQTPGRVVGPGVSAGLSGEESSWDPCQLCEELFRSMDAGATLSLRANTFGGRDDQRLAEGTGVVPASGR